MIFRDKVREHPLTPYIEHKIQPDKKIKKSSVGRKKKYTAARRKQDRNKPKSRPLPCPRHSHIALKELYGTCITLKCSRV